MRALRFFAFVSVTSLAPFLSACGSETPASTTPTSRTESAMSKPNAAPLDAGAAASAASAPALPAGAPDTPVGHQLAWVLDAIATIPSETAAKYVHGL